MDNTLLKRPKDCKLTIKPWLMYNSSTGWDIFASVEFYQNPLALSIIENNLIVLGLQPQSSRFTNKPVTYIDICRRLMKNPNLGLGLLIDRNWDWFIARYFAQLDKEGLKVYNIIDEPHRLFDWFQWMGYAHPAIVILLERHWDWFIENENIDWAQLCANHSIAACRLIANKWEWMTTNGAIYWGELCANPFAVELVRPYIDDLIDEHKVCWYNLVDEVDKVEQIMRQWLCPEKVTLYWKYMRHIKSHIVSYLLYQHHKELVVFRDVFDADFICSSSGTIDFIAENWDWYVAHKLIKYDTLCSNPAAIMLLQRKTLVESLCRISTYATKLWCNPAAIDIIKQTFEMWAPSVVILDHLFMNEGPDVMQFINANFDRIFALIVGSRLQRFFNTLCANKNIALLHSAHFERILKLNSTYWNNICNNKYAISVIEKYRHTEMHNVMIAQSPIFGDPAIFDDEYRVEATKWFRDRVAAELMAVVWHPRNIGRFPDWGIDPDM